MGKEEASKEAPKEEDKREKLTRNFGENYNAYFNRKAALDLIPIEQTLKRPIRSSVYWRDWPYFQQYLVYTGMFFFVARKMPFTNPFVRVAVWVLGLDVLRNRTTKIALATDDDKNELACFPLLNEKLNTWTGVRLPDFLEEHEDWYVFNKPAYRVPIGHETSLDSIGRYLAINREKFKRRETKWHGEWEQENALVMDLRAPHADHWLTTH